MTITPLKPQKQEGEPAQKPPRRSRSWVKATPYLLIIPAVLLELLIHIVPMVVGIWMSFVELTQFYIANWSQAPFAGLANYRIALDFSGPIGSSLLHSFLITAAYTVLVVGFSWVFGLAAALALQRKFRGRGVWRTLFLVPYALPIYAAIMTWSFMYQRDNGLVNHVLGSNLHITDGTTFWLVGNNAFVSMTVAAIWRSWPFAFLMLMAGLQNISEEVYDAAAVDGAGVWQQVRFITLPSLRSVNGVLVLMIFLWTFNDFNTPFVLFGNTPPHSADLLSIHIYDNSFINWNFGLGSAMSVLLLIVLLILTGCYLMVGKLRSRYA